MPCPMRHILLYRVFPTASIAPRALICWVRPNARGQSAPLNWRRSLKSVLAYLDPYSGATPGRSRSLLRHLPSPLTQVLTHLSTPPPRFVSASDPAACLLLASPPGPAALWFGRTGGGDDGENGAEPSRAERRWLS